VPAELATIIHRALAREPKARFPDANAFREALLDSPAGADAEADTPPPPAVAPPARRAEGR
jgi:hypothetical protein